jgi:hypothetical protein
VSAEQHEVVEARFTAVCPVNNVVTIDKLVIGAAREAAATISRLQSTPHWWWNGP